MTKTLDEIQTRLAVVIDTSRRAKPYDNDTNPMGNKTLADLVQGSGILKHADLLPTQGKKDGWMGPESLNQVVIDGLVQRKNGQVDKRKVQGRARALRKQQIDAIADKPMTPDPDRLVKAWAVMRPLVPIITRIANSKASWARRYLGEVQDDVTQAAMTRMVMVLAKGEQDLDVLAQAALELAGEAERTGSVPGDQVEDKDARRERKAIIKARKWLMGLVNNRVMGALTDLYTERHNLRWENLDIIETVMASINGAGEDPAFAHHDASKPPCFIASRMQTPGSIHPDVLRMAIAAAITERGLDRLCELLLDEDNLNVDGAFRWTANAERVFMATKDGEHKWAAVCAATEHFQTTEAMAADGRSGPAHARARAARMYVRNEFSFLPWLVRTVIDACDAERVAWRDGRAIMASAFDPDGFAEDGSRLRTGQLIPMVQFASPSEAARVLAESLATVLAEYDA